MNASRRARRLWPLALVLSLLLGSTVLSITPASAALTVDECKSLIEEGELARDDLAKLLAAVEENPDLLGGDDTSGGDGGDGGDTFDVGAYVEELTASAAINIFGFVPPVIAGAPLDLCLPEGTTALYLDGTLVLWTGLANTDPFPLTVLIPAGIGCSEHTLTAKGTDPETGQPFERTVTFLVAGDCGSSGTTLPVTGAQAGKLLIVAVGLIVLGGAALVGTRRRTSTVA